MFGNSKIKKAMEIQERHIIRLEKMVESLFNALMLASRSEFPPTVDFSERSPIVNMSGVVEPNPGEIFNPNEIVGRP